MRASLFVAGTALALLLAPPICAESIPARGLNDARVRLVAWRPDDVVRVATALRTITAIEFGEGESITAILAGDSESFEIVRLQSGTTLSVKPRIAPARANLVVYTTRRSYAFDLTASGKSPPSRIRFTYPETVADPVAMPPGPPATGPEGYVAAGEAAFRPLSVWDDGVHTYFRLAPGAPRPALFRAAADGTETSVNTTQAGPDLIETPGLSPRWTLRIGSEAVCIARTDAPAPKPRRPVMQEAANDR